MLRRASFLSSFSCCLEDLSWLEGAGRSSPLQLLSLEEEREEGGEEGGKGRKGEGEGEEGGEAWWKLKGEEKGEGGGERMGDEQER